MTVLRYVWILVFACAVSRAGELQEAAARGDVQLVRKLVQTNPAGVSARVGGTTALHEAVRAGHLNVVKLLVESGADVNATDFSRLTPLKLARNPEIATYLRTKGALEAAKPPTTVRTTPASGVSSAPASSLFSNSLQRSNNSTTSPQNASAPTPAGLPTSSTPAPREADLLALFYPIHEAARVGDVEQIKFQFKQSPDLIDATDEKGRTPLHIAAANFRTNSAQVLLSLRAKVNARTDSGQTPLHTAVRSGDVPMIQLLLANRSTVNVRDKFDNTPLLLAVQSTASDSTEQPVGEAQRRGITNWVQQLEIINLLLTNSYERADVNVRNRSGLTPLAEAIRVGNHAAVQAFLRAGANPDAVEGLTGVTPLHLAAARGHSPIAQTLVRHKANVNAADARGETPLVYALRAGHTNTIALLQKAGGNTGTVPQLTPNQKSLADFYEVTEAKLRRATSSEKGRLLIAMNPTKSEVERIFPKHSATAWKVVEQVNQQIKSAFAQPLRDADENKQIWRIRPEEPSLAAQEWRSKGWLSPDLPLFSVAVEKTGETSRPGDFCFVNGRWVLLPPLRIIAANLPSKGDGVVR